MNLSNPTASVHLKAANRYNGLNQAKTDRTEII